MPKLCPDASLSAYGWASMGRTRCSPEEFLTYLTFVKNLRLLAAACHIRFCWAPRLLFLLEGSRVVSQRCISQRVAHEKPDASAGARRQSYLRTFTQPSILNHIKTILTIVQLQYCTILVYAASMVPGYTAACYAISSVLCPIVILLSGSKSKLYFAAVVYIFLYAASTLDSQMIFHSTQTTQHGSCHMSRRAHIRRWQLRRSSPHRVLSHCVPSPNSSPDPSNAKTSLNNPNYTSQTERSNTSPKPRAIKEATEEKNGGRKTVRNDTVSKSEP